MIDMSHHLQERPDGKEHESDVNHREEYVVDRTQHRARLCDGYHDRQQAPGRYVAVGRAGERDRPQMRTRQPLLLYDTCQHREGGDTHGDAYEEGEG